MTDSGRSVVVDGVVVDGGVDAPVPSAGETWVVGAIVFNASGQVFAQKRNADRELFPGTWDVIGGHVEPGESLLEALTREVAEERWSGRSTPLMDGSGSRICRSSRKT